MPGPSAATTSVRPRAEFHLHAPQSFFRDAANGPAPSGMNRGDGAPFRIGQQDGNAIGGLHDEQDAALAGDQSVALRRCARRIAAQSAVFAELTSGRCRNESAAAQRRAFCRRRALRKNFSRFSSTRSRVSQSVKPRFRTFSADVSLPRPPSREVASSLAPPGRVLKP